jgi:hypothetical protein
MMEGITQIAMKKAGDKPVETLTHVAASQKNVPTAKIQVPMAEHDHGRIPFAADDADRCGVECCNRLGATNTRRLALAFRARRLYAQTMGQPEVLIDALVPRREGKAGAGIKGRVLHRARDFNRTFREIA